MRERDPRQGQLSLPMVSHEGRVRGEFEVNVDCASKRCLQPTCALLCSTAESIISLCFEVPQDFAIPLPPEAKPKSPSADPVSFGEARHREKMCQISVARPTEHDAEIVHQELRPLGVEEFSCCEARESSLATDD